jgi:predicted phosphodiesterase
MNAIEPGREGRALERADANVLLVGHTHEARVVGVAGGGLVVNPGALWTGAAEGGMFGVLELPARRFRVFRVADGREVAR